MSQQQTTLPSDKVGQENIFFEAFCKFDLETETLIKRIPFGPTKSSGEVFFHKRENASSEDDGYLMAFVYNWKTEKSEFVMWDAKTMSTEPILIAPTQKRVPNGFHSIFIPESEL